MATDERTQRSLGSATIISRRRFLKQTAFATAVASVPYLAGRSAAFGKEKAKVADAALDLALHLVGNLKTIGAKNLNCDLRTHAGKRR